MSDGTTTTDHDPTPGARDSELKRSITGRLLYFYVLGDVLGSGIYVLIGLVAGAVGGAFWIAFAVGVTIATITGLAYALGIGLIGGLLPAIRAARLPISKALREL